MLRVLFGDSRPGLLPRASVVQADRPHGHAWSLVPGRALRRRQRAHLDIDTTVTPVFGAEMQGAVAGPNPHDRGRPSYHPIAARVAETDSGVHAALRTGDTGLGSDDASFVGATIDQARSAIGGKPLLYVRIDAVGDCSAILRTIHQRAALFLVNARMTPKLCGAVAMHPRWKATDWDADGRPCREVAEIAFRRCEWGAPSELPVRVIVPCERDNASTASNGTWGRAWTGWCRPVGRTTWIRTRTILPGTTTDVRESSRSSRNGRRRGASASFRAAASWRTRRRGCSSYCRTTWCGATCTSVC